MWILYVARRLSHPLSVMQIQTFMTNAETLYRKDNMHYYMGLNHRHCLYVSVIFSGVLFVLAGVLTNWFDGAGEDNSDRDNQRKIFCEGRCLAGQNELDKPCQHPDVAPPLSVALDGPKLCKDNEWIIDHLIDLNEIKNIWNEEVEKEKAKEEAST